MQVAKWGVNTSTKPLSLNSTIPEDERTAETFYLLEPLNSLIYERYPFCMDPSK